MSRGCALELVPTALRLVVWNNGDGPQGASVALDPKLDPEAWREAAVAALRQLASELGAKGPVHVIVDRGAVLERHVHVPVVPAAELPALARFQAQRAFALPAEQLAVVWNVGKEEPEGLPMRLSAVRHVDLAPSLELVLGAGLKPGRGVLPGEALAHAARHAGAKGAALVLRSDEDAADLALLDASGDLVASRGVRVRASSPTALLGAVRRAIGAFPGRPERLLVLESDPKRLEVLRTLGELDSLQGADSELILATAAADPGFRHHPEFDLRGQVEQRAAREQKLRLGGVAAAVGVILLLCGLLVERQFAARRERIADLQSERENLAPAVERAKRLASEVRVAKAWSERRGRELEVLLLLAEALPEDTAYLTRVRWQDEGELLLTGMAKDWATVAAFVDSLERHPRVLGVTLEGIRPPREKGLLGVTFSARATLNPGGSS
ncbi:MAG: PilN domain-containing protein [Planctomycetes bacterium]|nr:PilN domain-containing protein [Planctomycetota bacterium]